MVNYAKNLVKGTRFVLISTLIVAIFGYLLRILLARSFSVEEYGMIYAIIAFFGIFAAFLPLGLSSSLVKFIPEFNIKKNFKNIKNSISSVVIIQFIIYLIFGFVIILFSKKISNILLHSQEYYIYIIVYSIYFIFSPLIGILKESFRSFQKMNYYSFMDSIQSILLFILTFVLIFFGNGPLSVFLAHVFVSFFIIILFSLLFIKLIFPQFLKLKFSFDLKLVKKLIYFGFPIMLTSIFGIIYGRLDTILISLLASMKEVGLYNVVYPTISSLWGLTSTFVIVLLPILSEMWSKKDIKRFKQGIVKLYNYAAILVLPITLTVFLFSEVILNILFGENFLIATNALKLLSFAVIFQTFTKINGSILFSMGLPKLLVKYIFIGGILNIIGNFVLIPLYGIEGAVLSTLISFIFIFIFSFYFLIKNIKINFEFLNLFKIFISSLVFILSIILIKEILFMNLWIEIVLSIGFAGVIYLFLIYKLDVIDFKDIKSILR